MTTTSEGILPLFAYIQPWNWWTGKFDCSRIPGDRASGVLNRFVEAGSTPSASRFLSSTRHVLGLQPRESAFIGGKATSPGLESRTALACGSNGCRVGLALTAH